MVVPPPIAVAWAPVVAVVVAVPLFLAFLFFVGMRSGTEETAESPSGRSGDE
jgi:uncharacterized membrane protein